MNQILQAFNLTTVSDFTLSPPSSDKLKLDAKSYQDYKKLLTQNLGKWRGGSKQHFEFQFDPTELLSQLKQGETPNYKQEWHYFPTPQAVVNQMCNIHIPCGEIRALEPSAGRGSIIKYLEEDFGNMCDISWDVIEMEPTNRKCLEDDGYNLIWDDFDTFEIDPENLYNLIYANPPFKKDLQHVAKILDLLDVFGSAVIVLPNNFETKYREIIDQWSDGFQSINFYQVPDGAFKETGTAVSTVIMHASEKL